MSEFLIKRSCAPVTASQLSFYNAMVETSSERLNRKFNLGAHVLLSYDGDGKIFISSFSVPTELRGNGLGHAAMNKMSCFADIFNTPMYLLPAVLDSENADGRDIISLQDVISFYNNYKFEFSDSSSAYMIRYPQNTIDCPSFT